MDKKNVRILTVGTFFLFSNVGSFLQHWALRDVLKDLGFIPSRVKRQNDETLYCINDTVWIKSIIKQFVKVLLHQIGIRKYSGFTCNIRSFRQYIQARLYKRDYTRFICPCIESEHKEDNILVLGGDQVFCEYLLKLSQTVKSKKRIIYGASCDWPNSFPNNTLTEEISQRITLFNKVGVREDYGRNILTQNGFLAQWVADPVMLVGRDKLIQISSRKEILSRPTLFCYLLNIKEEQSIPYEELLTLSKKLNVGLKMHGTQGGELFIPSKYFLPLGPCDFLKTIINAEYVITNSYHGTLLSAIFHKPFISIKQHDQNIRQSELLKMIGLDDNLIQFDELPKRACKLLRKNYNWDCVDKKMEELRRTSIIWLKESLSH